MRAVILCDDEAKEAKGEQSKEGEEKESEGKADPAIEQTFSDGDGKAVSPAVGGSKCKRACAAVRTVEGDRTGIVQMCVLNDGEHALTQNGLGAFTLWRVADLARDESADVPLETMFAEYAKKYNDSVPREKGLPEGVRVDTSTGVFQVVVEEGRRACGAALQSLKAAALKEGAQVDLFRTQSLGGRAAVTTHYKDPATLLQQQ